MIAQGIQEQPRGGKVPARIPENTTAKRFFRRKSTSAECMYFPFRNELFTFSTGFSTVFVKKTGSFP
jgi:hypothetical protein